MQLNRLCSVKLYVSKSSEEQTYNSDNENIYHPKFAWFAERSSLADINPKSYNLTAFELVNPLLYFYFPRFECRTFWKDLKSTLPSLLCCDYVTSLISIFISIFISLIYIFRVIKV